MKTFQMFYATIPLFQIRARSIRAALRIARAKNCMWTHIAHPDGREFY